MAFVLDAACGCHTGRVRKNNEDNFFFDGRCLEAENNGLRHPVSLTAALRRELILAVFDGMGGENFGEEASFTAASGLQSIVRRLNDYVIPEKKFLTDMCETLNRAVVDKARELGTDRMGTTLVSILFAGEQVYVCNLGDSRAYRLRDGEFLQISEDHVEQREGEGRKKAPLTQYLGIDPEECLIEPYIAKGTLEYGDRYLLCSDGVTDMLSNLEIDAILRSSVPASECVRRLIDAALEKGGKDNITAIVCRVM